MLSRSSIVGAFVAIHVRRHDVTVRRIGKLGVIDHQREYEQARDGLDPRVERRQQPIDERDRGCAVSPVLQEGQVARELLEKQLADRRNGHVWHGAR